MRWRIATTLVVIAGMLGIAVPSAHGQSSDDLKREAARIADQIERVAAELDHVAEDYVQAVDESEQLDVDITQSSAQVQQLRGELDGMRAALRDFAVRTFASGGQGGGLGELLGGSSELMTTVVKQQYATLALDNGQEVSDDLDAKLADLRAAETKLERQRKRQDELIATLEQRKQAAEEKGQELLALQNQTDANLQAALAAEQQAREDQAARDSEAELARIRAEERAQRNKPATKGGSSGSSNSGSSGSTGGGRGGGGGSSNGGGSNNGGGSGNGGGSNNGGGSGNGGGSNNGGGSGNGGGSNNGGGSGNGGGSNNGGGSGNGGGSDNGGGNDSGGDNGGGSDNGGGNGSGGNVPPPSPGASGAVAAAKSQLGVPYRFAAAEPGVAFDCSGLTSWAWARAGVHLPHQSRAQYARLPHVPIGEAAPGDLLFFHSPISHVSMYIGNGLQIQALHPGAVVSIAAVRWGNVVGVARPG